MHVEPITCYRPRPERAAEFAAPPYDVFDRAGARAYVEAHPDSFLAVDRPETAFPADHDPYADDVYARAHDLLASRVSDGTLMRDGTRCFYLWRLRAGTHEQTGIVAAFSIDDYTNGVIRRHELTRGAKVADRARHIAATCCQTGPALLAYRDNPVLEALVEAAKAADPLYELTDGDGVRHTIWRVARPAAVESLRLMLEYVDRAYIADGHRSQGLGLMLAQSVIELARKDPNTHRVVSLVTSDNAASIKLHEKLGFRFVGTLTEAGCKFGRYLDVMYLELAV